MKRPVDTITVSFATPQDLHLNRGQAMPFPLLSHIQVAALILVQLGGYQFQCLKDLGRRTGHPKQVAGLRSLRAGPLHLGEPLGVVANTWGSTCCEMTRVRAPMQDSGFWIYIISDMGAT